MQEETRFPTPEQVLNSLDGRRTAANERVRQLTDRVSDLESAFRNAFAAWVRETDPVTRRQYAVLEKLKPNDRYQWGIQVRLFNECVIGFSIDSVGSFVFYRSYADGSGQIEETQLSHWQRRTGAAASLATDITIFDVDQMGRPLLDCVGLGALQASHPDEPLSLRTAGRDFLPDGTTSD